MEALGQKLRFWGWRCSLLVVLLVFTKSSSAQSWLEPSDTFSSQRYYPALISSVATYSAFAIGLNELWYKDYPRSSFQFFNDWGEWQNLDKLGHAYNGYFQTDLIFQGARWTGLHRRQSRLYALGGSLLFQSTIEVLDGFSAEWGFSVPDMLSNVSGTSLFILQDWLWEEQRFRIKMNAFPVAHSTALFTGSEGTMTNLDQRAASLFTTALASELLKDYNAQKYWLSFHPSSLGAELPWWPSWLNVALGYGGDQLYGGFENEWEEDGEIFIAPVSRSHQYYASLDIDLTRLKVKNRYLKTILHVLNIVKIPLPALEYHSRNGWRGHWLR